MRETIQQREYNTGVSVLKIWMAMSIVVCHFLNTECTPQLSHVFTIYGGVAVSVFVFLSFLYADAVYARNWEKIGRRLYRLLLPQCFFSILYFTAYSTILFPANDIVQGEVGLRSFFMQLFFGAALNPPMWYLADLIILTILFYFIFYFSRKEYGILISILVAGIAIFMQYSGLNYRLWCGLPNESKWTAGRLAELIPIAVAGIVFSYYKIMDKISHHKLVVTITCFTTLLLVYKLDIFHPCEGFYYQGLQQVVTAICLGCFFWLLPFEKLPAKIRGFINQWACYNMGIIAMHYLIKAIYNTVINDVRRLSLLECLLIYAAALVISMIGTHIPVKYVRKAFR